MNVDVLTGENEMDLKEIKYFLAIAEYNNMSLAAEKLYVTQPALSHFLSKLESSLDVKLFSKQANNSLELTEAGKIYLEAAQKINEIQQDLLRQLADHKDDSGHPIWIGLSSEHATKLLTNSLNALYEKHPNIRVNIMHHTVADLLTQLNNNKLDFAYSAFAKKDPKLKYISFGHIEVDLMVPASHPLAKYGSVTPHASMNRVSLKELENEPFILLKKGTVLRDVLDDYFQDNDIHPNIKVELLSIASSISIIHDVQQHVGLYPRGYCPYNDGSVVHIALDPPIHYELGVYHKKNFQLTTPMKHCIALMKEEFLEANDLLH